MIDTHPKIKLAPTRDGMPTGYQPAQHPADWTNHLLVHHGNVPGDWTPYYVPNSAEVSQGILSQAWEHVLDSRPGAGRELERQA